MTSSALARQKVPIAPASQEPSPSLLALRSAVETQLRAMLEQGVSGASLGAIERFCHAAREALLAIEHPQSLVRSRFGTNIYNSLPMPAFPDLQMGESGEAVYAQPALAGAPGNETYGANVIRELMTSLAKLNDKKPPLSDLVTSLNLARATKNKALVKIAMAEIERHYGPTPAPTKSKKPRAIQATR